METSSRYGGEDDKNGEGPPAKWKLGKRLWMVHPKQLLAFGATRDFKALPQVETTRGIALINAGTHIIEPRALTLMR